MKVTTTRTVLCAICLLQRGDLSSQAFVSHRTRHVGGHNVGVERPLSSSGWVSSTQSKRQGTSLHVSRFQETIRSIAQTELPDDGAAFLQQLKKPISISDQQLGLLVLLSVPVAWGTYACTVQSLFTLEPHVPGFIFSTFYFLVAAVGSLSATAWQNSQQDVNDSSSQETKNLLGEIPVVAGLELGLYVYLANFLHVIGLQSVPSDRAGFLFQLTTVIVPLLEAFFARDLLAIPASTWGACALALAGIFVMSIPESAIDSAFGGGEAVTLSMDTALTSESISMGADNVQNAAAVVDTTLAMDTSSLQDAAQAVMDSPQTLTDSGSLMGVIPMGDALIVAAAFLYSMQILRISSWTSEFTPLQIMTGKTVAEFFFSAVFLAGTTWLATSGMDVSSSNAVLSFFQNSGNQAIEFFQNVGQSISEGTMSLATVEHFAGATVWTGLITTGYLVFAQSYGQQRVKASDANLIYSLQPLFTAIFAYMMLGETLQPSGFLGGALIGSGVYLVATKSLSAEEA